MNGTLIIGTFIVSLILFMIYDAIKTLDMHVKAIMNMLSHMDVDLNKIFRDLEKTNGKMEY